MLRLYGKNSLKGLGIFTVADFLIQTVERRNPKNFTGQEKSYDTVRTAGMAVWATFLYSPYMTMVFNKLNFHPKITSPLTKGVLLFAVSALPVSVGFLTFSTCFKHYFSAAPVSSHENELVRNSEEEEICGSAIENDTLFDSCIHQVTSKAPTLLLIGAGLWPMANTLTFRFVPPKNRVVVTSVLSLAWSSYVSGVTSGYFSPVFKFTGKS